MKIGILTFHRAINYGAILQCYALYMLLRSMGHDVEIIDYRPDSIEHDRKYFSVRDFNSKNLKDKVIYLFSCILQYFSKRRMKRIFDNYLRENVKLSKVILSGRDISKDYDAIFFGSDQIWNPQLCYGLDDVYYGEFDAGKAVKIAYAASLGRMELITDTIAPKFKKYVENYDKLSVREYALHNMLKEKYKIDSQIVCDPSLLPSKDMYYNMTHPIKETNYIALFILERNPEADNFAKRISEQTGAKVLKLCAQRNPLAKTPFEVRKELSPSDLLSYIRYARCVVTDSFHATSFSVIMNSNFYTIRRKNNNSRLETILTISGLTNRMVKPTEMVTFSDVNYCGVDERVTEYKKRSVEYIKSVLQF